MKYSIQVYDTTPKSNDPQHTKALAEHIHKATLEARCGYGDHDYGDRLDVYGLTMPDDTSDEERVQRCIAHQKAEIIARHSMGKSDFLISGTYSVSSYRRALIMINSTMD